MNKKKKKILLFIDWFLPGYKAGGPIRSCANLIQNLKGELDFFVVTRDTDYMTSEPYEEVKSDVWNRIDEATQVLYLSQEALSSKRIAKAFDEVDHDLVYINGIYSLYFSVLPLYFAKRKKEREVVVATRGMLASSAIGQKKWKKKVFLSIGRIFGLYKGITFHATNEKEANEIKTEIGNDLKVLVAPNLPRPSSHLSPSQLTKEKGKLAMVDIARISPEKNTLFALQVLKEVDTDHEVALDLYGPIYNGPYWETCRSLIKRLPENVTVTHKGSIDSEKVNECLKGYHCLFLPSQGENFGHIILEGFMAGRPVLISDQTPWKELEKKGVGWDLPLDGVERYREVVRQLCDMEEGTYREMSRKAFEYGRSIAADPEPLAKNKVLFF